MMRKRILVMQFQTCIVLNNKRSNRVSKRTLLSIARKYDGIYNTTSVTKVLELVDQPTLILKLQEGV